MKLAHISDLHFGRSNENDKRINSLIEAINDFGVDHLAITGDLTAWGSQDQYESVIKVLKNHDFFSAERLTVIPGNHDLFSYLLSYFHTAWDLFKRLHKIPAAFIQSLKFNMQKYNEELHRFYDFFSNAFSNAIQPETSQAPFPLAKLLDHDTTLITIDSNNAVGIRENKAASNGKVNLDSLEKLLQDERLQGKKKILLMHHYLHHEEEIINTHGKSYSRFMKLNNRDEMTRLLLAHGIDLVLHGHKHANAEYWIQGNNLRVVNGGGTYHGPFWNLIEITSDDIKVEIRH